MDSFQSQVERLNQLIEGIHSVMFTTINPDGSVNSRPMIVQDHEFDGSLWFFTRRSSSKVDSIVSDSRINIAFMDPGTNRYISMSGQAELIENEFVIKKMWSPKYEEWFAGGLKDPDLILIRFAVAHAEYWDTPHAEVVETFCLQGPPLSTRPLRPASAPLFFHS